MLAAALAGFLLVLAFPPLGWGSLAVPAVALFLGAVRHAPSGRAAGAAGAAFGLAFFTSLFPWIGELGLVALVPLVLSQAAYPTIYGALLFRARKWSPGLWLVAAAGGWAAMELARERFPVGGFPWGMLGYALGGSAGVRGAAQWVGTSGWSVVMAFAAAGLALALDLARRHPEVSIRLVALPVASAVVLAAAGGLSPSVPEGSVVRVAIVQGNTPCPGTHCENERVRTYQSHVALTRTLPAESVDLVVWPEGSSGGFRADPVLVPEVAAEMGGEAARLGAVLLAGGDRPISDAEWINANVVFDATGRMVGEYRKRHPVPFGEYIPGRRFFEWIPELSQIPRDMVRGDRAVIFELAGGGWFGSVISFESSFARYARDTVRAGAQVLVVATNQGSYPYSQASEQLIGMTRMRAAELGVDVVHAAVTGRSTLITAGGVVGEETPKAEPAVLVGEVRLREAGETLYARLGDWLQLLAVGAGAGALAGRWRSRRRTGRSPVTQENVS